MTSTAWKRLVIFSLSLFLRQGANAFLHIGRPSAFARGFPATRCTFSPSWTAHNEPSFALDGPASCSTRTRTTARHGLLEAYEYGLAYHHLPTVSLTSAVCGGVGDLAAQLRGGSGSNNSNAPPITINWKNNRIFWTKGAIGGLIWSQWYEILDPVTAAAAGPGAAAPWVAAVLSTAAEQFLFCPVIFAAFDLPLPMLLRGDPLDRVPTQVQRKLVPVLLENAKVWTLANLLVYSAPLQFRVLISGIAEVFWQMLLAQQLAVAEQPPPEQQPAADVYLPLMAASSSATTATESERAASTVSNRPMMEPLTVKQS